MPAPRITGATAIPPAVAGGAAASIRYLKDSPAERERQRDRVGRVRRRLDAAGIPHLANESHIIPVMVGDPVLCKQVSDVLLERFGIYVQPINYPTVPRGTSVGLRPPRFTRMKTSSI